MATITFWLSDEEVNQLRQLQRLRNETGSIHTFCKRIIQEYIYGRIKSLAIEKSLKEVAIELETLRKVLLDLQVKLEEKETKGEREDLKSFLNEVIERLEKFQGEVQSQGQSQWILDVLILLKELGIRVLLLSDKRKEFETIANDVIKKYRGGSL